MVAGFAAFRDKSVGDSIFWARLRATESPDLVKFPQTSIFMNRIG